MTRSRKKKASSEAREAPGQCSESREELRTPEGPEILSETELTLNKQQLQEVSAKNADIVKEAEGREKWHQKATFRRESKNL